MPSIFLILRDKVRPHGADFANISETEEPCYMVITQSACFQGYKDMDPKLIPQFEEGEREAIARKLLKAEGSLIHWTSCYFTSLSSQPPRPQKRSRFVINLSCRMVICMSRSLEVHLVAR
ncbi:hypothetical protein JOM56_013630 [Amanita muscaria]